MAEKKEKKKFFEQGGPNFFISTVVSRTREINTSSFHHCVLVQNWDDVVDFFREMTNEVRFRVHFDYAEIFTTPRLCEECMKHVSSLQRFEEAKDITECLCWIEKSSCGVHKR